MKITRLMLIVALYGQFQNNAPVRSKGKGVGKKGTNMYSPYPGNLKNNGISLTYHGVKLDFNKVGYIGYANARSKSPQFIERSIEDFVQFCIKLGGRKV